MMAATLDLFPSTDPRSKPGAIFSEPDRLYRYVLWRPIGRGPTLVGIGCNPSDADEEKNDPTVSRMVTRAGMWGFGLFVMLNASAWISTDPDGMKQAADPVGPDNDWHLVREALMADMVLCMWGNDGMHRGRHKEVIALLKNAGVDLYALHITKLGQPGHPLYLPYSLKPERWNP